MDADVSASASVAQLLLTCSELAARPQFYTALHIVAIPIKLELWYRQVLASLLLVARMMH